MRFGWALCIVMDCCVVGACFSMRDLLYYYFIRAVVRAFEWAAVKHSFQFFGGAFVELQEMHAGVCAHRGFRCGEESVW